MPVAMTGGFGSLPSSLKDKQRKAVLKLLDFNSSDHGEWRSHHIVSHYLILFLRSLQVYKASQLPCFWVVGCRLRFSTVARKVVCFALTGSGRLSIAELQVHSLSY